MLDLPDPDTLASLHAKLSAKTPLGGGKTLDDRSQGVVRSLLQNFYTLAELHPTHSLYKKGNAE